MQLAPLAGLTSLSALDLSRCGLKELPQEAVALPLRTLLLAGNKLAALPEGPYLAALERLDCGNNL